MHISLDNQLRALKLALTLFKKKKSIALGLISEVHPVFVLSDDDGGYYSFDETAPKSSMNMSLFSQPPPCYADLPICRLQEGNEV